ncbi:hypothetical protein CerSpe_175440 [Prunus speciosa]
MQVATMASSFALHTRMLAVPTTRRALNSSRTQTTSSPTLPRASLCTIFLSPFLSTSISSKFSYHKFRPSSLNLVSFRGSKPKRDVVTMELPKLGLVNGPGWAKMGLLHSKRRRRRGERNNVSFKKRHSAAS